MQMTYVNHNETEMMLIKPSEEVMECLESHQMELQVLSISNPLTSYLSIYYILDHDWNG